MTVVAHATTVRVRWGDTDPAGIVFYPRFFEWYDLGTETLFESLGLAWPELFARYRLAGIPILESGSRFLHPVRYGDVITIRSSVAWLKEKTFRMEHEIRIGDTLCAQGFEVRAWVLGPQAPGERRRAAPIPDEVARRLREG